MRPSIHEYEITFFQLLSQSMHKIEATYFVMILVTWMQASQRFSTVRHHRHQIRLIPQSLQSLIHTTKNINRKKERKRRKTWKDEEMELGKASEEKTEGTKFKIRSIYIYSSSCTWSQYLNSSIVTKKKIGGLDVSMNNLVIMYYRRHKDCISPATRLTCDDISQLSLASQLGYSSSISHLFINFF